VNAFAIALSSLSPELGSPPFKRPAHLNNSGYAIVSWADSKEPDEKPATSKSSREAPRLGSEVLVRDLFAAFTFLASSGETQSPSYFSFLCPGIHS